MIFQLLSGLINIIAVLGLVWLGLALLSAKWSFWRSWRRGYATLVRALFMGVARWLWSPEFVREGGGQVAQPRISYEDGQRWD